jgi:WD40 repeat protein
MSKQHWINLALVGTTTAISLALAQTGGFDPKKTTEILELAGPVTEIKDMAFSPDGKRLAVASFEATVRLWDVEQGRIAVKLTGHKGIVSGLSFYNNGQNLVTLGNDNLLKTWDVTAGKEIGSVDLKCNNIQGNGDVIALKDNRALVACAGLEIVDLKTGKVVSTFKGPDWAYKLAVSGDERTVLGGIGYSEFQLWDMQSLEPIRQLKGHDLLGSAVSYSADGKLLATGGTDDTARIWNANGKQLFVLKGHEGHIRDVALSPDSKILASASRDDTIKLWNVATGEELNTLKGHNNDVLQLAWSKDGKVLASGDRDGVIKLWGNP